ncbi:hypothetical protein EDD37DRAFT_629545 [Exophiala viscosa]|uniref:Zn(2)-C6 fungal-type domain-containing protein n=1 Tax=Exophiala viscosa TaxID=2486360 RepID=A0AAN6DMI7_9EURO|nr:hypothetical protein EDD36DRAFT_93240 [Exophiala viscosa]KAI1625429.1 hypothetical protein EDD37DRAFT_629545 [Exophiala viscosa]
MAPKTKSTKSSSTPIKRTRTGCKTCRQRKLKCDEAAPICGQCVKAKKPCVRSEGVTFRHHQNPSINTRNGEHSLSAFFGYASDFTKEERGAFLPVPQQLTWILVSDPNAEDSSSVTPPPQTSATPDNAYQQVAAHTLEALSTAAADHVSYPPQATAYYTAGGGQAVPHPEYGFVALEQQHGTEGDHMNNLDFLNTQANNASMMIDPNLEATVAHAAAQAVGDGSDEQAEGQDESSVAMALKNFNETSV